MTTYIGIDVGLDGAIAAICDGELGPLLFPMPTFTVESRRSGGKKHRVMDAAGVMDTIETLRLHQRDIHVLIETAQLRPAMIASGHVCPRCGKEHMFAGQGLASQAEFIGQFREIRGILRGLGIPFDEVHPATWKKDVFHGRSEKMDARILAGQLYPSVAPKMALKKNDGLAEALLIADYLKRHRTAPF